jgi:hypothetical protein
LELECHVWDDHGCWGYGDVHGSNGDDTDDMYGDSDGELYMRNSIRGLSVYIESQARDAGYKCKPWIPALFRWDVAVDWDGDGQSDELELECHVWDDHGCWGYGDVHGSNGDDTDDMYGDSDGEQWVWAIAIGRELSVHDQSRGTRDAEYKCEPWIHALFRWDVAVDWDGDGQSDELELECHVWDDHGCWGYGDVHGSNGDDSDDVYGDSDGEQWVWDVAIGRKLSVHNRFLRTFDCKHQ